MVTIGLLNEADHTCGEGAKEIYIRSIEFHSIAGRAWKHLDLRIGKGRSSLTARHDVCSTKMQTIVHDDPAHMQSFLFKMIFPALKSAKVRLLLPTIATRLF
jgi:hypothetical protein